jgi:hypothetical protein
MREIRSFRSTPTRKQTGGELLGYPCLDAKRESGAVKSPATPGEQSDNLRPIARHLNQHPEGIPHIQAADSSCQSAIPTSSTNSVAKMVEGYPVDQDSPSYRFMGFVPVFAEAGFQEVALAGSRRGGSCHNRRVTAASEPSVPLSEQAQDPETDHRDVSGGRLRPAVFGVMDGLVTNVSLMAGVGGGGAVQHMVILSGWAGLVAGSFSMATGEFASVRSQNELVESEVAIERKALATHPREERAELAASLVRRGVALALANEVAGQISESSDEALHFHTQEELGVDPDQLASPYEAAGLSFIAYAVGDRLTEPRSGRGVPAHTQLFNVLNEVNRFRDAMEMAAPFSAPRASSRRSTVS